LDAAFNDTAVIPGETYLYKVAPVMGDTVGKESNIAEAAVPLDQPGAFPSPGESPLPSEGPFMPGEPSQTPGKNPFPSGDPSPGGNPSPGDNSPQGGEQTAPTNGIGDLFNGNLNGKGGGKGHMQSPGPRKKGQHNG